MSTAAALAELAPEALDRVVTTPAQDLHRAVARRAFAATGPASAPVRVVHDAVTSAIYAGLRAGAGRTGAAASRALRARDARRRSDERRQLPPAGGSGAAPTESVRAAIARSALNGLIGDLLEERGSELALPMTLRHHGAVLPPDREALRAALPAITSDVVLFVHGLGETEHAWTLGGGPPYDALLAERGWTPLHLRYNTGRRVSDNGRDLSAVLAEVVDAWPVPVERLALVGHSMGGLVIRSAGHHGDRAGSRWARRVTHVVTLGTPHLGAPLEQLVHLAGHALAATPEARPIAKILRTRSAGIKDLRHGALCEEDWRDLDPDCFKPGPRSPVPPLPGARHCVVAATLGTAKDGLAARYAGDGLVGHPSACATGILEIEADDLVHLPRTSHMALLNDERVAELLVRWLAP